MKPLTILILVHLSIINIRLNAQESRSAESPQQVVQDDAPPDAWTRTLTDRAQRGTLHDRFQYVRGDSGKWNDDPIVQHAPSISKKPASMLLDDWADQLLEQDFSATPDEENWLLLRTRQLDDNDRVWVERIERRGNQFTIDVNEAIWQGRYSKTFTYYSAFGINLGRLARGQYKVTCKIKPQVFQQFEGDGRPRDNWPKDERPVDKKPIELGISFSVSAAAP